MKKGYGGKKRRLEKLSKFLFFHNLFISMNGGNRSNAVPAFCAFRFPLSRFLLKIKFDSEKKEYLCSGLE
jgi:hypothetical protein